MPTLTPASRSHEVTVNEVKITPKSVKRKLDNLNPNKEQGPDAVPSRVLKELVMSFQFPFAFYFGNQ